MDKYEKNGLGSIFNQIKQEARLLIKDENYPIYETSFKNGRYKIELTSENKGILSISISRNDNKNSNQLSFSNGFDKLSSKDLKNLLKCYLKEVFIYSNFNKFNNIKEISIYSKLDFITPLNIEKATAVIEHKYLKEILIAET